MDLSVAALSAFAGLEIPGEKAAGIFDGLGFEPVLEGDDLRVTVPSHRVDIEVIPDLYEEVVRHVGFAAIPSALPILPASPGNRDANWQLVDRARLAATGAGLVEIMTWSFIDPSDDALVDTQPLCPGEAVAIANPLATTQSTMRRSLLPGMVAASALNLNQGEVSLALFEQGRVFASGDTAPCESERLGVVLSHDGSNPSRTFERLKGVVEDVSRRIGLPVFSWRPGGAPWLKEQAGAVLVTEDDLVVGFAGLLADEYVERWGLRAGVAIAELDLDHATEPALPRFQSLPRHPSVMVDMTVEHERGLAYADLEEAVLELTSEWVEDLRNVARFVPPQNPSVVRTTLRLVYRNPDRSLTQDEVNVAQTGLRNGLAEKLGVTFA
jgi:phenylalanyl-tRNA synthetase beta chain